MKVETVKPPLTPEIEISLLISLAKSYSFSSFFSFFYKISFLKLTLAKSMKGEQQTSINRGNNKMQSGSIHKKHIKCNLTYPFVEQKCKNVACK